MSADGHYVVSGSRDGDVAVWDATAGILIARAHLSDRDEVRDCAITPDSSMVVAVQKSGRISVWRLASMEPLTAFDAPPATPAEVRALDGHGVAWEKPHRARRIALSPQGICLATMGWAAVDIWDLRRLKRVRTLPLAPWFPDGPIAMSFGTDDSLSVVERSPSARVVTWDIRSGEAAVTGTFSMPAAGQIERAVLTRNQSCLVASSGKSTVAMLANGEVTDVQPGASGQALAVSQDGGLVACGIAAEHMLSLRSLPDLSELWRCSLRHIGCRDVAVRWPLHLMLAR